MHLIEERENLKHDLIEIRKNLLTDPSFMEESSKEEKFDILCQIEESINDLEQSVADILVESNNMSHFELLQEINIRRIDKLTQRKLRKIVIAIQLAKQANDPLYIKYAKGVMLRKKNKELILKKYGNKAYQMAMQEENGKK